MAALSATAQKFVLHWGEMGTRWGINRTVAQIHALLYLSPTPLPAETIAETLNVARSNVSNSLRELQSWGLVRVVHQLGDRRDHFESMKDVWEMFRLVLDQRKKREVDPTLELLRSCVASSEKDKDEHTQSRLLAMQEFFETTSTWYHQLEQMPTPALVKFMKLGSKLKSLLGKS